MPTLISSLGIGVAIAILSFLAFYNLLKLGAKKSGFASALIVLSGYIVLAIFAWPGGDVFSIHVAIYAVVPYMLGIVAHYREQALDSEQRKKWFHWIPALFVLFFVVVVTVNMTLVTLAEKGMSSDMLQWLLPKQKKEVVSSQFPGVISHDYQEKEHQYNAYLEKLKKQKARGWQIRHGWLVSPEQNNPSLFQIEAHDKNGIAISGLDINLKFLRPSNYRHDKEFTMHEIGEGLYQQQVTFEMHGTWDVIVHMTKGDDEHEIRGDTFIQPAASN